MSRSINECVKRKKILIIFSSFHHIEFIILSPSKFGTKPDENRTHVVRSVSIEKNGNIPRRTLRNAWVKRNSNLLLCHHLLTYLHLARISWIHKEDLVHAMAEHGFSMVSPIHRFRLDPPHSILSRAAASMPCDCDYDCDVSMKMFLFVAPCRYQTPLDSHLNKQNEQKKHKR